MWRFIAASLLLPLRIYFQPTAFRQQVLAIAPELHEDFSGADALLEFSVPKVRQQLGALSGQTLLSIPLWVLLIVMLLAFSGIPIDWSELAFGVALGVALGVVFGMALSVVGGVVFGMTFSVALGVAFGAAGDVALGVAESVALGVGVGVAFSVAFGAAGGVGVGLLFGVFCGVAAGVTLGVAGGAARGITFGVAVGVAFGVSEGVTSVFTATHLWIWPLQALLCWGSAIASRLNLASASKLWRINPVVWDEVILLPLPGLTSLLLTLQHQHPALGRQALEQVAGHRYQKKAGDRALVQLAYEDAGRVGSLGSLAQFQHSIAWLTEGSRLPGQQEQQLKQMHRISREVVAAQSSDSVTNRLHRLQAAYKFLKDLQLQPGRFGGPLAQWASVLERAIEQAEARQCQEEPIPQVFIRDGRPLHTEQELAFKGRQSLFRQLEQALGGQSGQRSTLLLFGQRRVGKTSALHQLPIRLGNHILPIFLDLQDFRLGGASTSASLLSGIVAQIRAALPSTLQAPPIDQQRLEHDPYPTFGDWLQTLGTTLDQHTLLLCLDEFEALEEGIADGRFDRRLLNSLRSIIQNSHQIAILLTASHQLDELPAYWSSALINTTTLHISFFDEDDARELIQRPVEDFPPIYEPATVERIIELTHCHPHLIQLLCSLLVDRLNKAKRVPPASLATPADVDELIPSMLTQGNAYFLDLWRTQTQSETGQHVLSLLARAPGERLAWAALNAQIGDAQALDEALHVLERREIVQRQGDEYRVTVPLVAAFVRQRGDKVTG